MTRTMKAGEFKSKCLKILDEVSQTGEPLVITKHGKPVAKLVPLDDRKPSLIGAMKGQITLMGDIISPIDLEWDAMKD